MRLGKPCYYSVADKEDENVSCPLIPLARSVAVPSARHPVRFVQDKTKQILKDCYQIDEVSQVVVYWTTKRSFKAERLVGVAL